MDGFLNDEVIRRGGGSGWDILVFYERGGRRIFFLRGGGELID